MRWLAALLAWPTAAFAQPIDLSNQSLQDYRNAIAWYGASCVMNAVSVATMDGDETLAAIAEETSLDLALIRSWAEARAAEHRVATDVLTRGQEPPYDTPPEPFLMILRQNQVDCQTLVQRRRQLEMVIDRAALPDQRPIEEPSVLRPEIDPLPFDQERWERLTWTIESIPDALAEGVDPADLQALFNAMTGRDDVSISRYAEVETRRDAGRLALSLLVPPRRAYPDISHAELVELARRAQTSAAHYPGYGPPMHLYYLEMFRLNTRGFGTSDLFLDPDPEWLARLGTDDPSPEQIVEEAMRRAPACRDVPFIGLQLCWVSIWRDTQ